MSDETTPDLTAILADHFVMVHDLTKPGGPPHEWRCACGFKCGFSDTAIDHIAEQITAAGFGPVRAVQTERDALREAHPHSAVLASRLIHAEARAESAEAALAGVVAGVRKWCAINEIAEPPLDWAGLGEFLDRAPTPDREEHDCDGSDENPLPCWPACCTPDREEARDE